MLSLFHNRGQLTRKQRQHVQNAEKEFIKVAHGDGHERGFSYQSVAREWYHLIAEKPWDSFKTALKMTFSQIKSLDKKGTPVETTIDSVAWYLLSINPFLDYSFSLPGGHQILMLDWAEDENVLFPIVHYGKVYRYLPWQAKEAADPGPKAGRCLTPLQKWHVETFAAEGAGKAKIIGIHAPPIGPYTDWSDVDLSREKKIYEKKGKSRGPAKGYATRHKDGTTELWNGHPLFAITPAGAPDGMQADYGSFEQHRDWFIKRMLDPDTRGVRLIFSGHIHRNNLLVVHRGVSGRKDSAVAGELLVRGVFPGHVSNARFPAVTAKGDIGPLYVNTTSAGPRGNWYPMTVPDPKTVIQVNAQGEPVVPPVKHTGRGVDEEDIGHVLYGSVEPGFAEVELSNDGTIHRAEFRTVTGVAGSVPVAGARGPRRAVG